MSFLNWIGFRWTGRTYKGRLYDPGLSLVTNKESDKYAMKQINEERKKELITDSNTNLSHELSDTNVHPSNLRFQVSCNQ
jgi:hypothetical protein